MYSLGMAQAKAPPRTQRERSEATTAELVTAAREFFAADGYTATLLDDIVKSAGLTKGALYHHFESKAELFEAVFELEQERLAQVLRQAYGSKRRHWEGLYAACEAYFEAVLDPHVQRITLLDAPSVINWQRMREIKDRHTVAVLRGCLEMAVERGLMARRPLEPLVRMLTGAIAEAAMHVARADDQRKATREVLAELRSFLDSLFQSPTAEPRRGRASSAKSPRRKR
jgi:AcrR family transcriptional regulator